MKIFTQKIMLLIALVVLLVGAASCGKKGESGKPSNVDYYTCTMHPSVRSQDPHGKCPICSMDLIPVMRKHAEDSGMTGDTNATEQPTVFTVPATRQQLIGVTYATVEKKALQATLRTIG